MIKKLPHLEASNLSEFSLVTQQLLAPIASLIKTSL